MAKIRAQHLVLQRCRPPSIEKKHKFFVQNVAELQLDETDNLNVERMEWFDIEISRIYWRPCYSYIICSTIAFCFERVYNTYESAGPRDVRQKNSMVLTGVQGTGKSILGAFIALIMGKRFCWEVHYHWVKIRSLFSALRLRPQKLSIL